LALAVSIAKDYLIVPYTDLVCRFIIEGLVTVAVAVAAYFLLYDFPETASFLTPSERAFVAYRLKYDGMDDTLEGTLRVAQTDEKGWKYMKQALTDPLIYIIMVTNIGIVVAVYGISLSMPTM
jgi:sugar phosphate permease